MAVQFNIVIPAVGIDDRVPLDLNPGLAVKAFPVRNLFKYVPSSFAKSGATWSMTGLSPIVCKGRSHAKCCKIQISFSLCVADFHGISGFVIF